MFVDIRGQFINSERIGFSVPGLYVPQSSAYITKEK